MKHFATLLFTLSLSLSFSSASLASEPVFDTSTWDRYLETMGNISESVSNADSARFMTVIGSYLGGAWSDEGRLPMEDEDGNELDFELIKQSYVQRLSPLHGLTLTEIFRKYEADARAYAELHGLSTELLRY